MAQTKNSVRVVAKLKNGLNFIATKIGGMAFAPGAPNAYIKPNRKNGEIDVTNICSMIVSGASLVVLA